MSVEYYLCCHECQKGVWMACDGMGGVQFPWRNEDRMSELASFFKEHLYCPGNLTVRNEYEVDAGEVDVGLPSDEPGEKHAD